MKRFKLKSVQYYGMQETVTIPKKEYIKLKRKANTDEKFLKELAQSLEDIKNGRVKRVR